MSPRWIALALLALAGSRIAFGASDPVRAQAVAPEEREAQPRRGGTVVLHADALPRSLNYLIDNSTMCRRLQRDVHATLVARDPWTLEPKADLCERWRRDDALVASDGTRWFGALEDLGEAWRVAPAPQAEAAQASAPIVVPKSRVARVVRGAAYTFWLRRDVRWHDGHPFDARDVLFTWRMTRNPDVDCGDKRFEYAHITSAEALSSHVLRFEFDATYYGSLPLFEALPPLPSHLYDLSDPDNARFEADASAEEQARFVNEHRCNREWIGLGPYRLTKFTAEHLELERWDGYFDADRAGWIERVRYRPIADDRAALQALLSGEIDFTARLLSDDYFGAATSSSEFRARFDKGHFYTPVATYVAWNLLRPPFDDLRVRTALAHAFDWDEFIAGFYGGLARRVTAEWVDTGPDYDTTLAPLPHDAQRAADLLAQAGWIDRDGDGALDKDGAPFEFTLLLQAGNKPSEAFAQRFQEALAALGVRVTLDARDWPSMSEAVRQRAFDAAKLGWVMPVDSDPRQRWHSSEAGVKSSNQTSFRDADVDALIERIEVELERGERTRLMHELQRKLYAAQAYMYGLSVAKRYAIRRSIRNFRPTVIDPGYSVRHWWLAE